MSLGGEGVSRGHDTAPALERLAAGLARTGGRVRLLADRVLEEGRAPGERPRAWLLAERSGAGPDRTAESAVRRLGHRLLVIDHGEPPRDFDADLVVNPQVDAERREYSANAEAMLLLGPDYRPDGEGAARIGAWMRALDAERLEIAALGRRRARPADSFALWRLANDPSVRRNSFSPESIALEDHERWLRRKLTSPDCRIWVLEIAGAVAAQIRYERVEEGVGAIDYAIVPALRGKRLAGQLLESTLPAAAAALSLARLRVVVHAANEPSLRAFRRSGYADVSLEPRCGIPCVTLERAIGGASPTSRSPEA